MSCDMEPIVLRNLLQKKTGQWYSIGGNKLECDNQPAMPI